MTQDTTRPFLATINADRDQQIARIQADTDSEVTQIYAQAHAAARQLQRETNERLRRELSVRRHKEISRVQAQIRRKRWQSLRQLQHSINEQVLEKMRTAWTAPDWQWQWCRVWLQAAADQNIQAPMQLAIAETTLPETLAQIETWAEQNALQLSVNNTINEPGLIVSWSDFELDGLINSQRPAVNTAVLARLTPLLPRLHQAGRSS